MDVGEGPAGLVLLHADGAVSVKVGNEWKVQKEKQDVVFFFEKVVSLFV